MKARNVLDKEACESKYRFGQLEGVKNKSFYNGVIIRELFNKYNLNYTVNDIKDIADIIVPKDTFHTSREAQINLNLLTQKLVRFQKYMNTHVSPSAILLNGGIVKVIHNITVDYSFIVKNGDEVYIYKVKNKKNTTMKKNGKSIYTKISKSMELYLLQLAGEKLYPNAYVTPGIIFLSHTKDKDINLVDTAQFNDKANSNIVTYHFRNTEKIDMDKRIEDIMNDNVITSNKHCETCQYNDICNYIDDTTNLVPIPVKPKTLGKVTFTKHQQEVIDVVNGTYRVLAGAGSGKTTCIANRIVKLVKNGTSLSEILLITYTTKGVEEMKEKIEYWFKMNNIQIDKNKLNIFTFNGFGYELIKKEYKNLGFTKTPQLFEKSECLSYIQKLLDSHDEITRYNYANPFLDMRYAKGCVYQAVEDFEILKNNSAYMPEDVEVILDVSSEIAEEIFDIYSEYKNYMKKNNLIDYNDQVEYAFKILSDNKKLKKYGFEHIICDEFQDSDNLQINILEKLSNCGYNQSVMVVGDDSQSIFSWRGATSENIINFHKYFKKAIDIELIENFRSTQEICNFANKINDINKNKVDKQLIGISHGKNPILEMGGIESLIEKMEDDIKTKNLKYQDIAIISRNKSALLDIRQILLSKGIPCILSVSEMLVDNQSVKHICEFIKFLLDTTLDLSFAEYLQLVEYDTFEKEKENALFYKYLDDKKIVFLDEYGKCKTDEEKLTFMYTKIEEITDKNRAVKSLLTLIKEKNFNKIEEVNTFVQNMILFKSDNVIDKIEENVDAIVLTTAHSSKGREWENVYLYLDQFKYPKIYDYNEEKNIPQVEEERRLFFVAITRAKEVLTMIGHDSSLTEEIKMCLRLI